LHDSLADHRDDQRPCRLEEFVERSSNRELTKTWEWLIIYLIPHHAWHLPSEPYSLLPAEKFRRELDDDDDDHRPCRLEEFVERSSDRELAKAWEGVASRITPLVEAAAAGGG
jgi:hypothetical protein